MEIFGSRYELVESWKRIGNGWFAKATDLTLKREVLVYRFQTADELPRQETMRWLGKAAHISDVRYLHLLDVVSENDSLFAMLTSESGGPLIDVLGDLEWSGQDMLERIRDLISGIREARRERLLEFQVSAENIWLDGEGRLRFINYWIEGETEHRNIRGLSQLLYQLCAGTAEPPPSMAEFCSRISFVMSDLPGGSAEQAAEWACTAFQPSCTLGDYERGLNRLLTLQENEIQIRPAITSSKDRAPIIKPDEKNADHNTRKLSPPPIPGRSRSFRFRPWHGMAAVAVGLCVLVLWLAARPHPTEADSGGSSTTAQVTAAASQSEAPSQKPASSQATGSVPLTPSASPSPGSSAKPEPALQTKEAFVPNVVGHTREEAEKLVLAAGLRYRFILESNEMSQGLVFKQDLTPGTPVGNGNQIAFWVSKGK